MWVRIELLGVELLAPLDFRHPAAYPARMPSASDQVDPWYAVSCQEDDGTDRVANVFELQGLIVTEPEFTLCGDEVMRAGGGVFEVPYDKVFHLRWSCDPQRILTAKALCAGFNAPEVELVIESCTKDGRAISFLFCKVWAFMTRSRAPRIKELHCHLVLAYTLKRHRGKGHAKACCAALSIIISESMAATKRVASGGFGVTVLGDFESEGGERLLLDFANGLEYHSEAHANDARYPIKMLDVEIDAGW